MPPVRSWPSTSTKATTSRTVPAVITATISPVAPFTASAAVDVTLAS